jgi:hypothetical protein
VNRSCRSASVRSASWSFANLINSFTWSKAINSASADLETNGGDSALVNIANPSGDRGVSSYDQTLNDTLSIIADLPFGKGRFFDQSAPAWQQTVLGGWQVSAINVVSSGLPINLTYAPNAQYAVSSTSAAYAVRPNLVSAASAIYAPRSSWVKTASALSGTFNASQVSVPTPSQYFGNAGRNILRGPAFLGNSTLLSTKRSRSGWRRAILSSVLRRSMFSTLQTSSNLTAQLRMERVLGLTPQQMLTLLARCNLLFVLPSRSDCERSVPIDVILAVRHPHRPASADRPECNPARPSADNGSFL